MKLQVALLACSVMLVSCESSRIKENCKITNWNQLGYEQGFSGKSSAHPSHVQAIKQCVEYGFNPDEKAYVTGLKFGLQNYCTQEKAQIEGQKGKTFDTSVCPAQYSVSLNTAHQKGVKDFCLRSGYELGLSGESLKVSCPQETLQNFNSEFQRGRTDHLAQSVKRMQNQMKSMEDKLKELEQENWQLKNKNRDLEDDLRDYQRKLDDAERRLRH